MDYTKVAARIGEKAARAIDQWKRGAVLLILIAASAGLALLIVAVPIYLLAGAFGRSEAWAWGVVWMTSPVCLAYLLGSKHTARALKDISASE